VLEERHFARAAERLGMADDELARAVRALENEARVALIVRSSAAVWPTPAGSRFADHARMVLAGLRVAVVEARLAGRVPAAVRLGCVPDLPLQPLQCFLGGLYLGDIGIDVEVIRLRTAEQLGRLRHRELDLALVHDAAEDDGVRRDPVFAGERLAAFVPAGHPLEACDAVGPADLEDEVLLLAPRGADASLDDWLATLLAQAGYRFRDVRRTAGSDPRDLLFSVADRNGVTVAPSSTLAVVGDVATTVAARPLEPPLWMPDTMLAWCADPSPELAVVIDAARDVARMLRADRR